MRVTVARGDSNLTDLAHRLFDIGSDTDSAVAREVVRALRAANPHLPPRARLPEGALVVVPEVETARSAAMDPATAVMGGEWVEELAAALKQAGAELETSMERQLQREEAFEETLGQHDRELQTMGPNVAEGLARIREAAKKRRAELGERRRAVREALGLLGNDLQVLARAVQNR